MKDEGPPINLHFPLLVGRGYPQVAYCICWRLINWHFAGMDRYQLVITPIPFLASHGAEEVQSQSEAGRQPGKGSTQFWVVVGFRFVGNGSDFQNDENSMAAWK